MINSPKHMNCAMQVFTWEDVLSDSNLAFEQCKTLLIYITYFIMKMYL